MLKGVGKKSLQHHQKKEKKKKQQRREGGGLPDSVVPQPQEGFIRVSSMPGKPGRGRSRRGGRQQAAYEKANRRPRWAAQGVGGGAKKGNLKLTTKKKN